MSTIQLIITASGVVLSVFIAWFFWFAPKGRTMAETGAGGVQEVAVTVKGGYTPDVIVVKSGQPLRLTFTRQESSACSEGVTLEFAPDKPGEYGFQCKMGMLRGKLIVES
jgi:plastocyanin domain-containing protein